MLGVWKRLFTRRRDPDQPAPVVRCTHCNLVVEEPDSLFCPRCCRPLAGTGDCSRCFGCGACTRRER